MEPEKTDKRAQKKTQNIHWLQTQLNDVMENMLLSLYQEKPQDKVRQDNLIIQFGYMMQYLEKNYGERATQGDRARLQMLRDEAERLEKQVAEMREK